MAINFFCQDIKFSLKNKSAIREWIRSAVKKEKKSSGEINYILCDDEYLLNLNKKHLGHDTHTDILTFDYSFRPGSGQKVVSGDIFISIPRVKENAKKFNVSFEEELCRVIIHGILHLCGYGDKSTGEKKQMRSKEDHYLRILADKK